MWDNVSCSCKMKKWLMWILTSKKLLKCSFHFVRFFPPEFLVPIGFGVETWIWKVANFYSASRAPCFYRLEFPQFSLLHYRLFILWFSVWMPLPSGHLLWHPQLGQVILSQAAMAPRSPRCSCLHSHSLLTACSSSLFLTRAWAPKRRPQRLSCPPPYLQHPVRCRRAHTQCFWNKWVNRREGLTFGGWGLGTGRCLLGWGRVSDA